MQRFPEERVMMKCIFYFHNVQWWEKWLWDNFIVTYACYIKHLLLLNIYLTFARCTTIPRFTFAFFFTSLLLHVQPQAPVLDTAVFCTSPRGTLSDNQPVAILHLPQITTTTPKKRWPLPLTSILQTFYPNESLHILPWTISQSFLIH